ncbi:MAG: hypothetical protein ABI321_14995 [Polyangia bacterium]
MRRLAIRMPLALAALSLASAANAHPEWSPIQVNRYLKLVVGDKSRIVYTVLFGDGPALPERKAVDTDANGTLDARERALLGARIAELVKSGLEVELDGQPYTLPTPTPDVGLAGNGVGPDPFSVDLTYALALPPGTHELWIDDHVPVTHEGDSEIAIDAQPPAQLYAMGRGKKAKGLDGKVFTFRGPRFSVLEDRSVAIRFSAAPAPKKLPKWLWGAGALATAAALAIALRKR